jgi:CBS domain-containing protein
MATVRDLLRNKGFEVYSVEPDATVYDALKLMADKNVGAVLVLDSGNLVGILSERDYARKVVLQGRTPVDTPAREIMTDRVICVRPQETVEECMALMTEKKVRHLPVLEENELIGVISIGDVVKSTIAQKEFIIEQLEHYITGSPYPPPSTGTTD